MCSKNWLSIYGNQEASRYNWSWHHGITSANILRKKIFSYSLWSREKSPPCYKFFRRSGIKPILVYCFTNRLANTIGVDSWCRLVKRYGEAFCYKGKSYNYPFGLVIVARFSIGYISNQLISLRMREFPYHQILTLFVLPYWKLYSSWI